MIMYDFIITVRRVFNMEPKDEVIRLTWESSIEKCKYNEKLNDMKLLMMIINLSFECYYDCVENSII